MELCVGGYTLTLFLVIVAALVLFPDLRAALYDMSQGKKKESFDPTTQSTMFEDIAQIMEEMLHDAPAPSGREPIRSMIPLKTFLQEKYQFQLNASLFVDLTTARTQQGKPLTPETVKQLLGF